MGAWSNEQLSTIKAEGFDGNAGDWSSMQVGGFYGIVNRRLELDVRSTKLDYLRKPTGPKLAQRSCLGHPEALPFVTH